MQPASPKDILKVSLQRLNAAEAIFATLHLNLEAQYIGGYEVGCALKALILSHTPLHERLAMLERLTHGALWHRPEILLNELRQFDISLTAELAKRMRRFDWHTDLCYEPGRKDTGETRAVLMTADKIYLLFTFAPNEVSSPQSFREFYLNRDFEEPKPSRL